MRRRDALLFKGSARVAERRLVDFNTQVLAKAAWAFAKVEQRDKKKTNKNQSKSEVNIRSLGIDF